MSSLAATHPSSGKPSSRRGAAIYTRWFLHLYDFIVHRVENARVWRCPTTELLGLYDRNVGRVHLEVGVGTGYFLDKCHFPVPSPDITLFDLSPSSLSYTSERIRRFAPAAYRGDILQPGALLPRRFNSIGLVYLLHCLPGTMASKGAVFAWLGGQLADGGRLFGATVLGSGVVHGACARPLMPIYNACHIFDNRRDSLTELREALEDQFLDVRLDVRGSVALFEATSWRGVAPAGPDAG